MKKYVLNDKDLDYLKAKLQTQDSFCDPYDPNSIMEHDVICEHDEGFLCECRRKWILDYIKSKKK